ncbi:MAG: ATP-binding protein [Planctomycetota bacterium]
MITPERIPDLTSCDREPIHILGAVQPQACLVAVGRDTRIVAASQNASEWFGDRVRLGATAAEALGDGIAMILERSLDGVGAEMQRSPSLLGDVPVHIHRNSQGLVIAEFWRPESMLQEGELSQVQRVNDGLLKLAQDRVELDSILQRATDLLREATGFDRVMAYRFLSDDTGEVVAESVAEGVDSFMGLRYPASDIPRQARALYVSNRIRMIFNVHDPAIPVDEDVASVHEPLDLSDAAARSVSPVHIEYLRNMRVGASMSVSIVVGERLWGLLACHHLSPKIVPIEVWPMLHLLSQVTSTTVAHAQQQEDFETQLQASQVAQFLLSYLNTTSSMSSALLDGSPSIRDLIPCDGVHIRFRGEDFRVGVGPAYGYELLVERLEQIKAERERGIAAPGRSVVQFDAGLGPGWDAAVPGVLAIGFSDDPDDFIAWYRREVSQTVKWAGNPEKPVEMRAGGELRLSPRKSFEAWTECVSGTSEPWTPIDVTAASSLSKSLRDVVLRISLLQDEVDRRAQSERELLELTRDLEAFAYAASHDLRQPARTMSMRLSMLAQQLGDSDETVRHSLERATQGSVELHRLIDGMNLLARSATAEFTPETIPLAEVIVSLREDLAELIDETDADVQFDSELEVLGDRDLLKRMIANLVENAIKYRREGVAPVIEIECREIERPPSVEIRVRDNGQGIAAEDAERVFNAFARSNTDPSIQGNGLGLAICRRIAQRHGGDLTVESKPGVGSTFIARLSSNPANLRPRQAGGAEAALNN